MAFAAWSKVIPATWSFIANGIKTWPVTSTTWRISGHSRLAITTFRWSSGLMKCASDLTPGNGVPPPQAGILQPDSSRADNVTIRAS